MLIAIHHSDDPDTSEWLGSPKYLYDNSKLNIVGVILTTVVLIILLPIYYGYLLLYWIFHVGRK